MPSVASEATSAWVTLAAPIVALCALLVATAYYWTSLQTARDRDVQTHKQASLTLVRSAYTDHIRGCEEKLADLAREIPAILTASNFEAEITRHQLLLRVAVHNVWYVLHQLSGWFGADDEDWRTAVEDHGNEFGNYFDHLQDLMTTCSKDEANIVEREVYSREAVANCLGMMAALEKLADVGERLVRDWDHEDKVAPIHARLPLGRVWARRWHSRNSKSANAEGDGQVR